MTTEKLVSILNIMYRIIKMILEFGEMVEAIDDGTYVPAEKEDDDDVEYITG